MEKESVSLRILTRLFMDSSLMVNLRDKVSCTSLLEIIMLVSLSLIKSREEVYTDGRVKSQMFMKVSLSQVREMEEEHFGGQTAAGMKVTSKTVFNVALVLYIVKEVLGNMKESGRMVCLMVKESNILITDNVMKDTSSKINSMVRVYFTKMTLSFMVCGKITNYQLLIW